MRIGRLVAAAAVCLLANWNLPAVGAEESSMLVDEQVDVMPMPAYEAEPAMAVTTACDISYRTHRSARRMLRCQAAVPFNVIAEHPDPCACCAVEVPLCIPCCCTGAPAVTSDCGILGRGKVEYCWPCGFSATVVFRARGDVVVHYRG
jgi:hypothetical protein